MELNDAVINWNNQIVQSLTDHKDKLKSSGDLRFIFQIEGDAAMEELSEEDTNAILQEVYDKMKDIFYIKDIEKWISESKITSNADNPIVAILTNVLNKVEYWQKYYPQSNSNIRQQIVDTVSLSFLLIVNLMTIHFASECKHNDSMS